jgi:hypothetical protein
VNEHISGFRTTCGRQIRVGHLSLGGTGYLVRRVGLGISAAPGAGDGTWAGLTAAEARQLAAALIAHAAACEARTLLPEVRCSRLAQYPPGHMRTNQRHRGEQPR